MKILHMIPALLLLPVLGSGQATVYHPLPSAEATWREYSGGYQSGYCADYQDFLTGDTVFGEIVYKAIRCVGVQYVETAYGFCTWIVMYGFNRYNGAYRNDSLNRKVYYMPPGATKDTLLYDFNLEAGDTLPACYLYDPNWYETTFISEIDSVLVGNDYRRRYALSTESWTYGYLIEGIGSTSGLLGRLESPFEAGSSLICFMLGDSTAYPDPTVPCQLVSSVTTADIPPFAIRLSPNPTTGTSRLTFPPGTGAVDLILCDVTGQAQLRFSGLNDGTIINLGSLAPGLYIFRAVNAEGRRGSGKIVITRKQY